MYGILAVAGWIWTALFFSWLGVRAWRKRNRRRAGGFEVVTKDDKPG